jgi:uncharacterized protein YcbK (DUF882 family)
LGNINRREFLKWGSGLLIGSLLPFSDLRAATRKVDPDRHLALYNIHTKEDLCVCYYSGGSYQSEALAQLDQLLRDHRTDEIRPMDPRVLDMIHAVGSRIRPCEPFHVISGYRSAATNEKLRRRSSGVAKKSLHTQGQAIDIRLPGYRTAYLRDLCVNLRAGGVGYYPESNFVHLDIGRVRTW